MDTVIPGFGIARFASVTVGTEEAPMLMGPLPSTL
jgi:hypothetical protein